MWRYFFVVLLLVFGPLCGLPLVALAQTGCTDCVVSVTAVDDKYSKVRIVALTEETLRIKSPKLHPDGIPIKRSDLVNIVFPGGNPDAKGIVLKNGLVLNGQAIFLNSQWTIDIDGLDGEMLLRSNEILSINFRQEALIVPQKIGGDWQYNASFKVTEWIYSREGSALPAGVAYSFEIEKLVLAGNKLEVLGHLYSESGKKDSCSMECVLSDDKGHRYKPVQTKLGHIPKKAAGRKIPLDCPLPDVSAEVVIINLRNNHGGCGSVEWQDLPAFNLRLLKPPS
jgi:hypothetical protein